MAYEIGTATSHIDLMAKFDTFVTTNADLIAASQNWTTLRNNSGNEYWWKAPGLSGTEEIFVGVQVYEKVAADNYGWRINGAVGFEDIFSFWNMPGCRSEPNGPYLPLWSTTIPYWFFVNGQRAIIVAQIGTTYQHAYFGKINQFATPSQWPYPLLIGGMTNNETYRYSTNYSTISFPYSNSEGTTLFLPNGSKQLSHTASSASNRFYSVPYALWEGTVYATSFGYNTDRPILPIWLLDTSTSVGTKNVYGEFDGAFYVNGTGLASETELTDGVDTFIVFQNGGATAQNRYVAMKRA